MSKVKNILLKLTLEGQGIVNFDSAKQKHVFLNTNLKNMYKHDNNVSYSKKNFYVDSDGNLLYKVKISTYCLKRDLFKDYIISDNPNIEINDELLYSLISSPLGIYRGYTYTIGGLKRKAAFNLMDAELVSNNVSYFDFDSKSGPKSIETGDSFEDELKDESVTKKDIEGSTSLFTKEQIGKSKYETIGNIDLNQLQFLSCSQMFDRYSFNPDKFEKYKKFMEAQIGKVDSDLAYYKLDTSVVELGELGMLLPKNNILYLVNNLLKKIRTINIQRSTGYAASTKLEYKFVYDPLVDTLNNPDGWNEYTGEIVDFDPHIFYSEMNKEICEKQENEFKEVSSKRLKEKKEKQDNEKKIAKEKKEALKSKTV